MHLLIDAVWTQEIIWHAISCGHCHRRWWIRSNHYVGHVEHPDLEDHIPCPFCGTALPIRTEVAARCS